MDLTEIRPEMGKFKLSISGDTEYTLRKFSMDDYVWMKKQLGCSFEEVIKMDWQEQAPLMIRIAFHLLTDKSPFGKKEFEVMDETGGKLKETVGGAQLLGRMICGPLEYKAVTDAVMVTMNGSSIVANANEKKSEVT